MLLQYSKNSLFLLQTKMAPKSPKKAIKNEDRVKTSNILNKDGFLQQHENSKAAKNIIKRFINSGLLKFITFDYGRVHKKDVVVFYLNAEIGNDEITSKVNG